MADRDKVTFTEAQIDQLGHWLSECLDDAAPLNERVWRSRAEWMVGGPTFQAVMRQREADLRERLAAAIEAVRVSSEGKWADGYVAGRDKAASIVRPPTADTEESDRG